MLCSSEKKEKTDQVKILIKIIPQQVGIPDIQTTAQKTTDKWNALVGEISKMATPIKTGRKKSTGNTAQIAAKKEPDRSPANRNRWNATGEIWMKMDAIFAMAFCLRALFCPLDKVGIRLFWKVG